MRVSERAEGDTRRTVPSLARLISNRVLRRDLRTRPAAAQLHRLEGAALVPVDTQRERRRAERIDRLGPLHADATARTPYTTALPAAEAAIAHAIGTSM